METSPRNIEDNFEIFKDILETFGDILTTSQGHYIIILLIFWGYLKGILRVFEDIVWKSFGHPRDILAISERPIGKLFGHLGNK